MARRRATWLLGATVLLCLPAHAQTVDEVIASHLKARGGVEKIKAIKSTKMTGKMTVQGMEASITIQGKRPNLHRTDVSVAGTNIVQAFDGTTAWWVNSFAGVRDPDKMPPEQAAAIRQQADLDGPLVDYKEKGHKVELVGKEEPEGTPVYKLKVTLKSGDAQHIYLDGKTYLERRRTARRKEAGGNEIEVETLFSDYKPVNGIMLAHALDQKTPAQSLQLAFTKIELDVPVEDSAFKMPPKSEEKPASKP